MTTATAHAKAREAQSFKELAQLTSKIWQGKDGLAAQQQLRDEWCGRSIASYCRKLGKL